MRSPTNNSTHIFDAKNVNANRTNVTKYDNHSTPHSFKDMGGLTGTPEKPSIFDSIKNNTSKVKTSALRFEKCALKYGKPLGTVYTIGGTALHKLKNVLDDKRVATTDMEVHDKYGRVMKIAKGDSFSLDEIAPDEKGFAKSNSKVDKTYLGKFLRKTYEKLDETTKNTYSSFKNQ